MDLVSARILRNSILGVLVALSVNGCSFANRFWGEAPPARKTVVLEGDSLPPFETVFDDDSAKADQALQLWKNNIIDSFNQIEGSHKNFLTMNEALLLVREGFVKLSDDRELSVARARAVLTLLGFKNGISLDDVKSLFGWLEKNREQSKTFYRKFIAPNPDNTAWTSKDLAQLMQFFGSLVELGGDDSLDAKRMASLIVPWIPDTYPHAKASVESGLRLGISFFASFCGDRVEADAWNGRKIGQCIHSAVDHFLPVSPVLDFIFGNLNPFTSGAALKDANDQLVDRVQSWLEGHHHPRFPTERVADFASSLSIPPPYNFFQLTGWIPKLNADSTAKELSPTFFVDLTKALQQWIGTFQSVTAHETCSLESWKYCEFKGQYRPADQLYSDEYATLIRIKDMGFIDRIALYDSLASFLIQKLDTDGDGILNDNIHDLIGVAIHLLDSNSFAYNVVQRIQEHPVDLSSAQESMQSVKRQGLAELAAFASDLIPERGKDGRSFLKKLQAQIYSKEKTVTESMDQLGITAFLYVYDLINSLREDYLTHDDLPVSHDGSLDHVKRRKIIEALPRILFDHFPRIYNACVAWGFERTCGVVYTEVLPSADEGRDDLETYEMDVITLSSILIESMMNRCDRDHNDRLSSSLIDGFDEKHCMINVSEALARRLMNANIVEKDSKAEMLMNLVRRIPFARWIGKVALARGSMHGMGLRVVPPISLISGPATIGSVLSLAAEFMDSDKVKAIENQTEGPQEDPGDELLYFKRLTNGYLPSQDQALRSQDSP